MRDGWLNMEGWKEGRRKGRKGGGSTELNGRRGGEDGWLSFSSFPSLHFLPFPSLLIEHT